MSQLFKVWILITSSCHSTSIQILYSNNKVPLGKNCLVLVCILPLGSLQMKCMLSFEAMICPYFINFSDSQFSTQLHLNFLVRHIRPSINYLSSTSSFSCFNFYPETLNCSMLKTQNLLLNLCLCWFFTFYLEYSSLVSLLGLFLFIFKNQLRSNTS